MAWWQKKLLHYALSRTGLLDDKVIDPKNLDITLGRLNVVDLKDVGLNIKRISKLAQLPPGLRIETARILSLKLTIPADIYQSSIVAEVDGVELCLTLEEQVQGDDGRAKTRAGSPTMTRTPEHRKVHRRLHSPPPFDPGGLADSGDVLQIPTMQEMAKSFLMEEPIEERRELEASVAANAKGPEESFVSESSEGDEVGIGGAVGLPGFLAGFLRGILDRLEVHVKNVEIRLDTELPGDGTETLPVTLRVRVGNAELASITSLTRDATTAAHEGKRYVQLNNITADLLSDATVFSELSDLASRLSPTISRSPTDVPQSEEAATVSSERLSKASTRMSPRSDASPSKQYTAPASPKSRQPLPMSIDTDRFADADDGNASVASSQADLDIRAGDDNISWGSRRNKATSPATDLWNSMASEVDLPDSLLLDRTSTPRAGSLRTVSPTAARTRRAVSPYDRSLKSPGSWPRLDESPTRQSTQRSPGSWPTMDQRQESMYQRMTPDLSAAPDAPQMDNKRTALESAMISPDEPETPPEPAEAQMEALSQSRLYSHEEAESMYMSAMTQSPKMHVPGGWGADASRIDMSPTHDETPPMPQTLSPSDGANESQPVIATEPASGNVTPRAQSPELTRSLHANPQNSPVLVARQLFSVDSVSLWIPTSGPSQGEGKDEPIRSQSRRLREQSAMPGTFSAYSDLAASRGRRAASTGELDQNNLWSPPRMRQDEVESYGLEIQLGKMTGQVDFASCRILHRLALQASSLLRSPASPTRSAAGTVEQPSPSQMEISLCAEQIQLSLVEAISQIHARVSRPIVALSVTAAAVTSRSGESNAHAGSLKGLIGDRQFLSFDRHHSMSTSVTINEDTPEITIKLATTKFTVQRRPVTELALETMPLIIDLDIRVVDEALSSFGGLSGALELSISILSEKHSSSASVSASKPVKGVRFQGDPEYISPVPEVKFNGRIGGADLTLRGEVCSLILRASTIKAVYREAGASATIEQISLTGPYRNGDLLAPIVVDLTSSRLDFLPSPQDNDLERLLTLLTPSKDKYDNDEDILIDTLLRQRHKGAVVRVNVSDVKVKVSEYECFGALSALGSELAKLSAVAKYLPEDDRPGILSLVRLKAFGAQLPVNDRFGKLRLACEEVHLAYVGLPALIAFSTETVKATQTEGELSILHPLLPLAGPDKSPMLMARMLGDEVEPTAKVKIFNFCVEYSVPTALAFINTDQETDAEELVKELAKSVANLALLRQNRSGSPSSSSAVSMKRTNIVLLVHDSAIGLTPPKLPSKALLVLTDAQFAYQVPPEETSEVALELRKAAVFITDRAESENVEFSSGRSSATSTTTNLRLAVALSKQGYVSVASIMKATILAQVRGGKEGQPSLIDVDVKNELLLLETCADSTQTLSATLAGLAPPTPPSRQQKYLTEPMTIEDMMASFTGDPFAKPETAPETLFDVAEEAAADSDLLLDATTLGDEHDDLLMESDMTSSLYGPVSGILEGIDEPDGDEPQGSDFPETVESLLEEDPFVMPMSPADTRLGDSALIRELNKQFKSADGEEVTDLGMYEIEDLGFDALGPEAQILGTQHRFNTPASQRRKLPMVSKDQFLPFRLRLRDIHIIWNMYDGYDWQRTRDEITQAVEQVETRAEERKARRRQALNDTEDDESVIGDFLFNSIYVGVPSNHDAQELRRQINRHIDDLASETESVPLSGMSRPTTYSASGRPSKVKPRRRLKLERSRGHKIAFELKGVSADVLVFPPESKDIVSSADVRVKHFEIFDNVPTSTWRKFLTQLDEPSAREMSKPVLHIELLNVRTLEDYAASEIVLHVTVLPLRLHVDQDALDFITRFFEFKDERMVETESASEQPFLQRVEIDTVDLQLDYKPKRIDYVGLRSGHTTEFMNFVTLDAANIRLRHAIVYGIKGFEPLHKTLNDVWMPDIRRNQLPTVLAGLASMRSLVNLGSGVRDVIAIPIREYRKDGRVVRSIQKGAFQFGKTTASELARLGAKIAIGTQNILSGAEELLSPASASPFDHPVIGRRVSSEQGWHEGDADNEDHEQRAISAYSNQPLGLLSGLRSARRYLEHDLLTAKDALIAVQGEVLESRTPGAAAAAVVRHAPTVILRPVIGASRAVGTTLLGVGNQIDRGNMRKVEDKYKRR